jgi:hypothetical protein
MQGLFMRGKEHHRDIKKLSFAGLIITSADECNAIVIGTIAVYLNIQNIYIPQGMKTSTLFPGLINLLLTLSLMICVIVIF